MSRFNIYVCRKLGVLNSCSVGYLPIFCWNSILVPLSESDLSRIKEISTSNLRNNCKDGTSDILFLSQRFQIVMGLLGGNIRLIELAKGNINDTGRKYSFSKVR